MLNVEISAQANPSRPDDVGRYPGWFPSSAGMLQAVAGDHPT